VNRVKHIDRCLYSFTHLSQKQIRGAPVASPYFDLSFGTCQSSRWYFMQWIFHLGSKCEGERYFLNADSNCWREHYTLLVRSWVKEIVW